jgi:hypothetical protein
VAKGVPGDDDQDVVDDACPEQLVGKEAGHEGLAAPRNDVGGGDLGGALALEDLASEQQGLVLV